jgi:hypothetical protein
VFKEEPSGNVRGASSRYVGTWDGDFKTAGGKVVLSTDGTGYVAGGVWGMTRFSWREEGDHVAFNGWKGSGYDYDTGRLSPDGKVMELTGTRVRAYPVQVFKEQQ